MKEGLISKLLIGMASGGHIFFEGTHAEILELKEEIEESNVKFITVNDDTIFTRHIEKLSIKYYYK